LDLQATAPKTIKPRTVPAMSFRSCIEFSGGTYEPRPRPAMMDVMSRPALESVRGHSKRWRLRGHQACAQPGPNRGITSALCFRQVSGVSANINPTRSSEPAAVDDQSSK
jgi:hypothetical protein